MSDTKEKDDHETLETPESRSDSGESSGVRPPPQDDANADSGDSFGVRPPREDTVDADRDKPSSVRPPEDDTAVEQNDHSGVRPPSEDDRKADRGEASTVHPPPEDTVNGTGEPALDQSRGKDIAGVRSPSEENAAPEQTEDSGARPLPEDEVEMDRGDLSGVRSPSVDDYGRDTSHEPSSSQDPDDDRADSNLSLKDEIVKKDDPDQNVHASDQYSDSEAQPQLVADQSNEAHEQQSVESLSQVESLKPENWQSLDVNERLEALQDVENRMANLQQRPPAEVMPIPGGPGEYGQYNRDSNTTYIGSHSLEHDPPKELVNTTVHEGRHAYQCHAIENSGFHPDVQQVAEWESNMPFYGGDYYDATTYGQAIYQSQPVEADAWAYGDRIANRLYEEDHE